jgi:chromosomal replication initiator protein
MAGLKTFSPSFPEPFSLEPISMHKPELKNRIHQFLLEKESEFKNSFLNSIHIAQDNQETLSITFPHLYFREWFHAKIRHEFEQIVFQHDHQIKHIKYDIRKNRKGSSQFAFYSGNGNHSLDHFLHNEKNYFPYVSASKFSHEKKFSINPFIICGENGSGKTHILNSMANNFYEKNIHEKIFLCSMNELNYFYHSKMKKNYDLHEYFLSFDCLFIDDLQDIIHYKKIQDEMICIIDTFHERNKPMVFACCDTVAAQSPMDSKLKSRLEGGFIIHLELPDLDIRIQFVQERCRDLNLALDESQILEIAQACRDFKTLSRVMLSLLTQRDLSGHQPREDDIRQVIEDHAPQPVQCDARAILNAVAEYFDLAPATLTSGCRTKEVVFARQVAMTLCRQILGHSYAQVGLFFGGRNHSSVLHSVKKIKKLQTDNSEMKNMFKLLKKKVSHPGSSIPSRP